MSTHLNDDEMNIDDHVTEIQQGESQQVESPVDDAATTKEDPTAETDPNSNSSENKPSYIRALLWAWKFFLTYDFPILLLASIGVAKLAPEFGAVHLAPEYSALWVAVALIFFLSGISLEIEQCIYAFTRFRFNAYVLLYNFGFVSAVVFGISRGLKSSGILSPIYSDGLVLCGALPLAVNAVSILTVACHGDEAVAIFNEAVSNMIGVFLSPLLIRGYLGAIAGANLPSTFWKLIVRVIVPLVIGQILRYFSTWVVEFRNRYKVWFTRAQKYLLVYIEYTLFCTTFKKNLGTGIGDAFTLVLVVFILQVFFLTIAWAISHYFYRDLPRLRVVGLFGPVAKTTSLGIPLILSLYQSNPRATIYTLPVLIWHPMLLVVGSILTPCLRSYVEREVERVEGKPVDAVESSEESDNGDEETPKEAGESEATKDKSG